MNHVAFKPMGGNLVGTLPQPSISMLEAQIFGRRLSTVLEPSEERDDIMASQVYDKHMPVPALTVSIAGVMGFAARR